MTISVLVCKTDGTQVLEEREVSDQYLQMEPPAADSEDEKQIPSAE